jgi:hypothetical protein
MAMDTEPDLILITESWCNADISQAYLSVDGYELQPDLRLDRDDTDRGRGGGLLVYSRVGLPICVLEKTVNFNQYCSFQVYDISIYLVYRSPNAPQESMEQLADLLRGAKKNALLVGDFNIPDIDWEKGEASRKAETVLRAAEESLMEQLVTFPTQVRGNILDWVLTNMPERVE